MGGNISAQELGNRPLEFPNAFSGNAEIFATQSRPERHLATMETSGRVCQKDISNTVAGWVDARGNAFRNDFNRMQVGRFDSNTGNIYSADYSKTLLGKVDEMGFIYLSSSVVHQSGTQTVVGRIVGPPETYRAAACAYLTLWS